MNLELTYNTLYEMLVELELECAWCEEGSEQEKRLQKRTQALERACKIISRTIECL